MTRAGEEISSDVLPLPGYERYKATDYRLAHIASESLYYIVSPKDIVLARPPDVDDRISWLIERRRCVLSSYRSYFSLLIPFSIRLKEALDAARTHERELRRHSLKVVGQLYLSQLFDEKRYEELAAEMGSILQKDKALWEAWVFKFEKETKALHIITNYIPTGDPLLQQKYEVISFYFISLFIY